MSGIPSSCAAGTVPWRIRRGRLEVALVHRPRYDDWSWPKGKLDPGESWAPAAVRETVEETGLPVVLGSPLPTAEYPIVRRGRRERKVVRYWSGRVVGPAGPLVNEIDAVAWLEADAAAKRLDYPRDRDQLAEIVALHAHGALDTRVMVILRHAKAMPRSAFSGTDDRRRPLDALGRSQADALVPVLRAFGVTRVVTSSADRCVDTVAPFMTAIGKRPKLRDDLTEEAFEVAPDDTRSRMRKEAAKRKSSVICGHGPVIPTMIEAVQSLIDVDGATGRRTSQALSEAIERGLAKGEWLALHIRDAKAGPRIVAVERSEPVPE